MHYLFTLLRPLTVVVFLFFSCTSISNSEATPPTIHEPAISLENIMPGSVSIRIRKSAYQLDILQNGKVLKTYPVVLGPDPVNDKLRQGDGATPEGHFKLRATYPHKSWSYFLWIDYPNAKSWEKHNAAKKAGKIPKDASIGGEVGIHGVPAGRNDLIENQTNWTLGCISLTTEAITEIYPLVGEGTAVEILH